MRLALLPLWLAMLPGCIFARLGAGVSHQGNADARPTTYDSEVGVAVPLNDWIPSATWMPSVMRVNRHQTTDGGRGLAGLELAHFCNGLTGGAPSSVTPSGAPEPDGRPEDMPATASPPPPPTPARRKEAKGTTLDLVFGRIEAGHDDLGRYVGAAMGVRRVWALPPLLPSIQVLVTAGTYTGPVKGPSAGLHVLIGNF